MDSIKRFDRNIYHFSFSYDMWPFMSLNQRLGIEDDNQDKMIVRKGNELVFLVKKCY